MVCPPLLVILNYIVLKSYLYFLQKIWSKIEIFIAVKVEFKVKVKVMSHSTSSEQIAEPDPFRFGSNFAHVFVGPKWEILKIFGPLDPLLPL